jgi:predicted nuclease with TOPRIM domain
MFDIFNTRKLKEAIATGESLAKTAKTSQNEWRVAQEHSKELIKIVQQLEVDIARKNEEISKLTDEYNALVKNNEEVINNYNKTVNSYNEIADKYNNLTESIKIISIQKTRTSEELNEYPEDYQHIIVDQWTSETKLELLNTLADYIDVSTVNESVEQITEEYSISILKPNN